MHDGHRWKRVVIQSVCAHGRNPHRVCLTVYAGESEDFMRTPLNDLARQIEAGTPRIQLGRTFHLDEIVEAHRVMEENKAGGKIVVLT